MEIAYITVRIDRPEYTGPVVELVLENVRPLCDMTMYQYVGQLLCFQVRGSSEQIADARKKVRRLSRGKLRFTLTPYVFE